MQTLFTFMARVLAGVRSVTVTTDGANFYVRCEAGIRPAPTQRDAIRLARDEIGHLLSCAERTSAPWGLYVSIDQVCAFYGDAPPAILRGNGSPLPPSEPINKIRSEYRQGGPIAALQNAIRIVEAYLGSGRRRAA
jgi:hypothetical protein